MSTKSFYDLDYIIEINEQRLQQFTAAYLKVLERFTNLIVIYSAIAIFIVPIIQEALFSDTHSWLFISCFVIFLILFLLSMSLTVKLIIPEEIAYLESPKRYYEEYRITYEQTISDQKKVEDLLKASYINELETASTNNELVFRRKSALFYNALMFALLSTIPYLMCVGFHISKKEEKVQKVQIVNLK